MADKSTSGERRTLRTIDPKNYPSFFQKGNHMIIKLKRVRLAFPQLWEAKTFNGEGAPAYSGSFILEPNHPSLAELEAAIVEVAEAKWPGKGQKMVDAMKAKDKLCLHDGDTKADYSGFPGNMYVSARNQSRVLVVDRNSKTELSSVDGRPYAGCYVNVSLEIWAQDNSFGKRINATLRAVQFVEDGDAFSGGTPASIGEFDDVSEGADSDELV